MHIYFPESLFEIAGNALNQLPEPLSWSWTVPNVMDWVEHGLKLPQYVVIFKENNIDGKKLIFVNCQTLSTMNITDFGHIKWIAKNVRRLYGLPPDNDRGPNGPSGRRGSVHDLYGRYYAQLAAGQRQRRRRPITLFQYALSVGMVAHGRATRPRTSGPCASRVDPPPPDAVLLARLPATEYLRGGQCAHADTAVVRLGCAATGRPEVDDADGADDDGSRSVGGTSAEDSVLRTTNFFD